MSSAAIAPVRLPFAPRPISTELLSSWLLRVAAANCVEYRSFCKAWNTDTAR